MINLLFLTIFPILVGITIFLFNIGTKEIIDGKNGFNEKYFKPMGYAVVIIFLIPTIFLSFFMYDEIIRDEFKLCIGISIVCPGIIYLIFYNLYKHKLKVILNNRENYENNNETEGMIFVFLIIFLLIFSILITFNSMNIFELKNLNIKSLKEPLKSENTSIAFLIKLLITIIIPYIYMVIVAGYIYNYSKLFGFVNQELIFSEEGKDILETVNTELKSKKIEVYILVESDEYITFKINNMNLEPIKIKSEYIVARKPIQYTEMKTTKYSFLQRVTIVLCLILIYIVDNLYFI